jgi:predicted nucleic acid-binding protein
VPEPGSSNKGVLLDTSILIELLRSNGRVQAGLNSLIDSGYSVATATACVAELYGGLRAGEESVTAQLLATLECLDLTYAIAKRAGDLKTSRSKIGRTHSIVDMMIAATAQELGYVVATENLRDFEIPGLEVVDLTETPEA